MAEMMKALVVAQDGGTSVCEVPRPRIGEYEALVKMRASALCGTDMKILHNNLKGFADYPTILGHEGVGEVVALGGKVRNFQVGDMVVLPYILDKCGEYFSTWGALAEYATVGDTDAMVEDGLPMDDITLYEFNFAQRKIPKEMDPVAATMIVTFREVYSTLKRLGFESGQSIVIYGAGPVGLAFLRFARLIGMAPVVCVDITDEKARQGKEAGADYVFNSSAVDLENELRALFPDGVDVLLDAAGVPALINQNLKLVKNFGKVCVYGVTKENYAQIDWQQAPFNFDLRFAQWPSKKEEAAVHDEIISFMQRGELEGMDYISDIFGFDEVLDAMALFQSGKNQKKIAVRF